MLACCVGIRPNSTGKMAPSIRHTLRLLLHHGHARGGPVLPDGGFPRPRSWASARRLADHPRQTSGVLLRHASIGPVVSRAQQQMRLFCSLSDYCRTVPKKDPPINLRQGINRLEEAFKNIKDNKVLMLEGLAILEKVAANYSGDYLTAKKFLDEVKKPIIDDLCGLDDGARSEIVKASLSAIWTLLQTAPSDVGITLRSAISSEEKLKSAIEMIIRDTTGGWDEETRNHAREILANTGVPK